MELGSCSEDRLDQIISGGELEIGRIRLLQMAAISEKRRRKSHLQDGYRSMVDWMAARVCPMSLPGRSIGKVARSTGSGPAGSD
ncbi:MAG: hypothetical protein ABW021_11735 [Acidimicrobiia bacterium]